MASRNRAPRDCPSAFCEVVSRAMAVSGWHACIRSARMRVLAGMILLFLFTSAAGESPATMESVRAPHEVSLSTEPRLSFWPTATRVYARVDKEAHAVAGLRPEFLYRWA